MRKRKLTRLGKLVLSVMAVCLAFGILFLIKPFMNRSSPVSQQTAGSAAVTAAPEDNAEYESKKQINSDYIGHLRFESGLIDQDVVQSGDNEKYLNLSWDLKQDTQGAAFMDYRNILSDQNLIIYGHYVYYDVTKMFSPLEQLTDQKNYEANKYISLELGDETRKYVVTDVFYYEMDNESLEYYYTAYGSDYFTEYYAAVKEKDFYDTGESLTPDDHWISLQTCVRDHDELREIVLARQIS